MDKLYNGMDAHEIDFTLPSFGVHDSPVLPLQAMPYGEALHFLRHFMRLPWSSALITGPLHNPWVEVHIAQLGMSTRIIRGR